jgi:hypothetical protein
MFLKKQAKEETLYIQPVLANSSHTVLLNQSSLLGGLQPLVAEMH